MCVTYDRNSLNLLQELIRRCDCRGLLHNRWSYYQAVSLTSVGTAAAATLVFNADHPYSVRWKANATRMKY